MRPHPATFRSRTAAIAAGMVLAGGLTAGLYVNMQEASDAAAALERETRAQALTEKKAAILAAARADVLADAERPVTRARDAWAESTGKVDEALRAQLDTATQTVDTARANGDHAAILAAMPSLLDLTQQVEDATEAQGGIAPPDPAPAPAPAISARPAARTITGTLHVRQQVDAATVGECGGYGRFAEFQNGTHVVVEDPQGRQVGHGELSACEWKDATPESGPLFSYAVPVAEGAGNYSIHIGWKVWEPVAEPTLRANGWRNDLTVE